MAQKLNSKKYNENSSSNGTKVFAIISVVLFIGFGLLKSQKDGNRDSIYITQAGQVASYSKESLDKLIKCANHQDSGCTQELLDNGEIFELPAEQEVYVVESEFSGKVKIRLGVESQDVWTTIDAIKSK